ncbi:hypothetical protein POM88_015421 [Heracleum sosnowskyi]|uniref:F-box associated beta-propeller type 1 domain-containing protein n=1 Tax=Heracleum sosnowskyi TaxID=360622 RepID=A0AAD8MXF1_9APIA|nr:hypothetical protein POM88_015421 [Heracleum sosnowskyi]
MKHELQLIGSINGLVCLFSEKLHRFVIFNPATGQAKNIDVPDTVFKRYCPISISGFCWDAVKNDYKVIIPRTYGGIVPEDPFEISYFYSCKTDSWSTALNKFPFIKNIANCFWARSVIVNGMPYWTNTGFCKKKRAYEFYVIKFEPARGYLMCFDQETKQIKGFRSSFQVYLSYNFSLVFLEGMKPFQEIFQDYVL